MNIFVFLVVMIPTFAWAGLFGPSNAEECILEEMKGVKSDQAARAVMYACEKKFPSKKENINPVEVPDHQGFSGLGVYRPTLNSLIGNISIVSSEIFNPGTNSFGVKSYDYHDYYDVTITNRNPFPITGIEIGLITKSANKSCSWSAQDYNEVYICWINGGTGIGPNNSGTARCDIPKVRGKKFSYCITGFAIHATPSETRTFMAKNKIPSRKE